MAEPVSWRRRPLFRLLPLIVIGGLGILLWKQSNPPEKRLLRLELRGLSSTPAVDLQIVGADGELVQRTEQFFPRGRSTSLMEVSAPLRRGGHSIRAFAPAVDGGEERRASTNFEVGEAEAYDLRLIFRGP